MRVLIRGSLYFALVFAVGFALGAVRVLWLVPRLGERAAELLEAPFMLAASFFFARWVVRRLPGESRGEHLASRDPVSGTVYAALLLAFALMPWLVAKRSGSAAA